MGRFPCRPLALTASLMLNFVAPSLLAQTVQQVTPTNLALADGQASALDLRSSTPLSRPEEAALRPQDRFRECSACPEMIVVPDGVFMMGSRDSEPGSAADERPRHQVAVQAFAVGRSPVTSEEWSACVKAKGCVAPERTAASARDPVSGILWQEARDYVAWLSHTTGRPYRLLSEAEREYVTRAGTETAFWWGDGADPRRAEAAAAADLIADVGIAAAGMTPTMPPLANPFGLRDVHGGVYDWVEDCWHDNYMGAPNDGSAWTAGDCTRHVLRGGAAGRPLQTRRSAARLWFGPPNRTDYMSLRVARTLAR